MDVTVTNISASPVYISDLYTTIAAGASVSFKRSASQLSAMVSLQKASADALVTIAATMESFESASGLAVPPGTVEAADMAAVAATDIASGEVTFRKSFVAAAAGAQDDVVIFAANALPYKMRILEAYALVSTVGTGAATLTVRDEAAGAGTAVAVISSAATGRANASAAFTASVVLTPGATKGLFIRRADRDAAGEIVITARRES